MILANPFFLLLLYGTQRNAIRLNGTSTSTSSSLSATRTGASAGSSSSTATSSVSGKTSGAERAVVLGFAAVLPMAAAAFLL